MVFENIVNYLKEINPILASAIEKSPWILPLVVFQILMKIIFYPIALYTAAKNKQKTWFIVLFICFAVLNDFGLLAILYIAFTSRIKEKKKNKKQGRKRR